MYSISLIPCSNMQTALLPLNVNTKFLSWEFRLPGMQATRWSYLKSVSREETVMTDRNSLATGSPLILTAATGDGGGEKRWSKQRGVTGQGLGRGKAGMQRLLPGVLLGEGGEGAEWLRAIGAVRKPERCVLTQRQRTLFLLIPILTTPKF